MKHLLTLTALLISSLAMAQMPYNPDSNGDDLIGSEDLLTFLGVYNTLLVDSSLTCDYEGTDLESWIGGLFDGTLILDSVYVEYLLSETFETFLPGCPDPVLIETVLDRGYMLTGILIDYPGFDQWRSFSTYLGYSRQVNLEFDPSGNYAFYLDDREIEELTNYSRYSRWNTVAPNCCIGSASLPFPEDWTLDDDGIQVDWQTDDWAHNCQHLRVIPYWSEAE